LKALTNFADDNFVIRWNINLQALNAKLESDLGLIIAWLRDSGLKVKKQNSVFFIDLISRGSQAMLVRTGSSLPTQ
jgi:hypothetical protein